MWNINKRSEVNLWLFPVAECKVRGITRNACQKKQKKIESNKENKRKRKMKGDEAAVSQVSASGCWELCNSGSGKEW